MKEDIAENILAAIGGTPLVRLHRLAAGRAEVLAKIEYVNPGGSVKDRIARAMLETAEAAGALSPGAVIIEPTSGNTGIGLALAAAVKGYRLILTMPETMSSERCRLLAAYGAQLELTAAALGMRGAIARAHELHAAHPGSFMPQQFSNRANPDCHRRHTAAEIWQATGGRLDAFIAGVGTGGTLSGAGEFFKEHNPGIRIYAVEPAGSPVLSGGQAGPHALQGLGAGFIPDVLNTALLDGVMTVSDEEAAATARAAARLEGILAGPSGGAALHAALTLSRQPDFAGKRLVVLIPDSGERYLSTSLFDD